MSLLVPFVGAILALFVGSVLGYYTRQSIAKKRIGTIEQKLQEKISQAQKEHDRLLIEAKEINLSMEDLSFIRTTEQITPKDAKSLREEFQYGTKTDVNKVLLTELLQKSKIIVEKIEVMLSEM